MGDDRMGATGPRDAAAPGSREHSQESCDRSWTRQQPDRLALLHALIEALSDALTVQAVADVIIGQGLAALQANVGVVAVASDGESSFTNVRVVGYPDEVVAAYPGFAIADALPLAAAIRMRAPLIYESRAAHDADYPRVANVHAQDGSGALVAIPLRAGERIVGGLGLSFPYDRSFEAEDRAFMRTLAELCGQALERTRLYEEERRAREAAEQAAARAARLQTVTAALSGARTPLEIAAVVTDRGVAATGARAGFAVLLEDDGITLQMLAPVGYGAHVRAGWQRFAVTEDLPIAEAVRTGAPGYIGSRDGQARRYPEVIDSPEAQGSHAWASLPLQAEGRTIGALGLSFATPQAFDGQERTFLNTLAGVCAQALARAQLYEATQAARATAEAQWRRLQAVLDVMPEAVLIADTTPRFLMCNVAAQTIMGADVTGSPVARREDELLPGSGVWRADGTPWPIAALPLQRALFRGETVQGEQLVVRNGENGVDTPVLANSVPLRDADGAITGAVAVFQDITTFKDLERQRDEFLATISHDLKNPLTAVIGMGQLLQRRAEHIAEEDRTRMVEGLGWMLQTAQRMTRQINGVLDITRLRMGRPLELERSPVDLTALLTRLLAEYQQTTERHTLRLVSVEQALIGRVDEARLERAIANVLSNALKYSPEGGAIIVSLSQSDEASGAWATIRIADQGIGIPDGDLPRIFERYFRASNVAARVNGTGLGLTGVRQIVEQHGGSIAIESAIGEGTAVVIRVPLQPQISVPGGG